MRDDVCARVCKSKMKRGRRGRRGRRCQPTRARERGLDRPMLSLALSLSLNWFLFIPSLRVAVVKIRSEIQSLWSWVCYQTLSQVSGSLMVSVVAAQARPSSDSHPGGQGGTIPDPDPEPEQQSPGSSSGSASGPGPILMFLTQQVSPVTQVCDHFLLAQRDQSKRRRYRRCSLAETGVT